ncbi:hypothetical protein N7468_006462 [Penicillium chermesinum]|uniref:Ankyrin repeat protein n=1 Tax=Penicillium chermesinum TaxID=63820 RepID=A0A9W9NS98_9EURO|nr:uncharacterized protein N7468_006462 [Penicillium chermesinum]KAJ5225237.1 hypothetical protein N7468_006462 [Penicillium chermesinum]KAJ6140545.1 hypothetical protein N7470_010341 [Penicillium chermesinum]
MNPLLCDNDAPQNANSQAELQRELFSTVTSMIRSPRKGMRRKRLQNLLRDPVIDVNFHIDGISLLAKATSESRVLAEVLRHEGIDLNLCNPDGRTSIFFAVENRKTYSLRLLIKKGALLDERDNQGRTPLSLAAELGNVENVRILVESNADINLADSKGWTPLFWAASRQHLEAVDYLLSTQGVNSDHQDIDGRTPLAIASETGDAKIIRCLLDAQSKGRLIFGVERDLLLWAIFHRDIPTAQLLLKVGHGLVNYRIESRTPLSQTKELGHIDMTEILIDAGADMHALNEIMLRIELFFAENSPTMQPPLSEAESPSAKILQGLLDAEINVNSLGIEKWSALAWAVEKRHDVLVKFLLEIPGISVDSRDATGQTPLIMAARLGETNILNHLLESSAAINSEDEQKWTSLSWAVANDHEQTVKLLLRAPEVFVDHKDKEGRTPFSLAAERGYIQIMLLLIKHGADPHVPDNEGHTGFWRFLRARYDKFIRSPNQLGWPMLGGTVNPFTLQFLVWALPLPNKKDRSGRNWLSWAAEYGDNEVIQCFLNDEERADKVDINICDGTGDTFSRTPLIWALERGNDALIDLLKDGDTISLHLLVEGISSIEQEKALGLVTTLLQAGYEANQPDQNGRTPLHLACLEESKELIAALIKANAKLDAVDHTGKIPLQYALKVRNKAIIDLLLEAPSAVLEPVRSHEWFAMGNKVHYWIQITRMSQNRGFELKSINKLKCDWLPRAKEARLCICEKSLIWSRLPQELDIRDKLNSESYYWNCAQKDFGYRLVTYISLTFPYQQGKGGYPWGIAWISRKTAEGLAYGFISMLPSGWVPSDPSDFFNLFLEALYHKWRATCSDENARIEKLRHDQLKNRGGNYGLVDELAKNALERAELRQCLQSHIEGLLDVVKFNASLQTERKSQLREVVDELEQTVTTKLDNMEQAVRDLLQIELAWVSTKEAASFKRLSWISFIFLPLMFVSNTRACLE